MTTFTINIIVLIALLSGCAKKPNDNGGMPTTEDYFVFFPKFINANDESIFAGKALPVSALRAEGSDRTNTLKWALPLGYAVEQGEESEIFIKIYIYRHSSYGLGDAVVSWPFLTLQNEEKEGEQYQRDRYKSLEVKDYCDSQGNCVFTDTIRNTKDYRYAVLIRLDNGNSVTYRVGLGILKTG